MTTPESDMSSVVMEREMPYPAEKIWRALTEGQLIKQWLLDNDFEPVVGRKFKFRATPMPQWDGVVSSEVLVVEQHRKLSYRWDLGDEASGFKTTVHWTLTPTERGTLLRMEHSGFRPDQGANYQGAKYGWQKFINGLEKVLTQMEG